MGVCAIGDISSKPSSPEGTAGQVGTFRLNPAPPPDPRNRLPHAAFGRQTGVARRNPMRKFVLAAALMAVPLAAAAQAPAVIAAFMAAHHTMMHDMDAVKPTGDADKDFVMMMIPHHQGAIDMAKVEIQYGTDAMLKAMAEQIVASQQKEIEDMKKWQAAHP
jgi:hypothetical protein